MKSWSVQVIALLVVCGLSPVSLAAAAPVLTVDDPIWNVGIIIDKQAYEKTISIVNTGDEPLVIEKIEECCGFSLTLDGAARLLPGETARLTLTVSTFKLVGDLRAEAFIYSNDPVQPKFSIFALGQVVPKQHALAELMDGILDLGVIDPRDQIAFRVRVRNSGTEPLTVKEIERPATIIASGSQAAIPAGEMREFAFQFVPDQPGPIEDRIVITTNDALDRALIFQLKGYVSRQAVSDHALSLQPVGKTLSYDPGIRAFPYRFTMRNQSSQEVEILNLESSLPLADKRFPARIEPGESADGEVSIAPKPGQVPVKGYIYFLLAVPVEVR